MADEVKPEMTTPPSGRRRLVIGANVLMQIAAALALVAMINWLASRHYVRFDWTKSGYYKVSDKTKQVLQTLKEPVKVVVFLQPAGQRDPEYIEKIFQDSRNLLKEFAFFGQEKLSVEYVDPQRDLARAKQLVEEYQVDVPNVVIFACGPRHKYVSAADMVDMEQASEFGGPSRIRAFKAEGAFLAAIQTVIEEEPPKVYFLTGHGEHDPDDYDERAGYSTLASYIKRDNIEVLKWNLLEQRTMPTNAAAVVVAGPRTAYGAAELSVLDQYLKNRGRVIVLIDPGKQTTGLEGLLGQWGVQADNNVVVNRGSLLGLATVINVNALGVEYAPHPITASLQRINTEFPYARSVRRAEGTDAAPGGDQPRVTELVKSDARAWGETNLDAEDVAFDEASDTRGPLSMAVAVETGRPQGVDVDLGVTRLVVVGTSSVVDNSSLTQGNLVFFMNSLNWLMQREQLVAVGPKTPDEFRLDMTPSQVRAVYALVILGLPVAVAATGLMVWMRRRK
jgi:ABC-type uncharacterized transport system involved in gliding motility auxiliary subunit